MASSRTAPSRRSRRSSKRASSRTPACSRRPSARLSPRRRRPARSARAGAWRRTKSPAPGSAPPPRRKVEYGTGIVVSVAGHILTDRQLIDGCNVVEIAGYGDADRIAEEPAADLALLRIYRAPALVPAVLAPDGARNTELTLLG